MEVDQLEVDQLEVDQLEVDQLEVCSDSQLVVKQIKDDYEAKGEKIIRHLNKVRELLKKIHTGSGKTHPKDGEFMGGRPS